MILAFAAMLALGTTSCKKDWDCVCDGDVVGTYPNVKKADAKEACDAFGDIAGEDCSVK